MRWGLLPIDFAGHRFLAHHSGALYWPEEQLLFVADLHLGKGLAYARNQQFLPPYDTVETIRKLLDACDATKTERLIFVGDTFHTKRGSEGLSEADLDNFASILHRYSPIWVEGNHDMGAHPSEMSACQQLKIHGVTIRHIAVTDSPDFEISGHFHPSVRLSHKGQRLNRPCFLVGANKLILPAFGALTGGLDIDSSALTFVRREGRRVYALGHQRVFAVHDANTTASKMMRLRIG